MKKVYLILDYLKANLRKQSNSQYKERFSSIRGLSGKVCQKRWRANLQYLRQIRIIYILQSIDQEMSKSQVAKRKRILLKGHDKYDKIAYREKMFLLKGVFIEKAQIKETAQRLGINYSTAKTFLRKFKARNTPLNNQFICNVCNWFVQISRAQSRCTYRNVADKSSETSSNSSPKDIMKEQNDSGFISYICFQKNQNPDERPRQIEIVQQVLFKG